MDRNRIGILEAWSPSVWAGQMPHLTSRESLLCLIVVQICSPALQPSRGRRSHGRGTYERACLLAKHEPPRPTSRHGIIERPVRRATKSARRTRAISMSATVDHGPDRLRNRRSHRSNFGVNGGRHRQGIAVKAASGTPMRKADESAARSFDKAISGLEVAHLLHRVPVPAHTLRCCFA